MRCREVEGEEAMDEEGAGGRKRYVASTSSVSEMGSERGGRAVANDEDAEAAALRLETARRCSR